MYRYIYIYISTFGSKTPKRPTGDKKVARCEHPTPDTRLMIGGLKIQK